VAAANQLREVQIPPLRGRILDRNGHVLADNRRRLDVVVDRPAIKKKAVRQQLFLRLAGALGTTPDALEKRYNSDQYDPYLPLPVGDDVDESVAVFLKERYEDYPGVSVEEGWQRVYRFAPYASQVIGYVGKIPSDQTKAYLANGYDLGELVGRAGVEQTFEDELRGKPGVMTLEVDAQNRVVQVRDKVDPTPGDDVQLSMDVATQVDTEQLLKAGLEVARTRVPKNKPNGPHYAAPAGAAVVLDPTNGQVIAMASYPTYDNRWFIGGIDQDKFKQVFPDGTRSPLVNRAITGRYNLGSNMKLFTAITGLQSGELPNTNATIDYAGIYTIPNCPPVQKCDWKNSGTPPAIYGRINLPLALSYSSDVYFYRIGAELWIKYKGDVLQNGLRQFGLGSKTGIDLPGEYAGLIPDAAVKADLAKKKILAPDEGRGYFTGDNIQLAIGQGLVQVTPVQLATGYSAFANGGTVYKPQVALAVLEPNAPELEAGLVDLSKATVVKSYSSEQTGQVAMNPEWRAPVLQGLQGVILNPRGTAYDTFKNYDYAKFPLAAKTGTSQDASKLDERDNSLFSAFGPIKPDAPPQYEASAIIEQAGYGAWGAAPVVKCIFEGIDGQRQRNPLQQSEPLDRNSNSSAQIAEPVDQGCLQIPNTARD
jgi:penicillin-binding protein 2